MSKNNGKNKDGQSKINLNSEFHGWLHHHLGSMPEPRVKQFAKLAFFGGIALMHDVWIKSIISKSEGEDIDLDSLDAAVTKQLAEFRASLFKK